MCCLRSFRCSFCCIFLTLFTLFLCCILSIFLFWIIISPSSVKFQVTNASLTQFNLSNNTTTLNYKFKVNITARNPKNNVVVYYRRITAYVWYKDRYFATINLVPFDQGHKNTTLLQEPVFEGQSSIFDSAQSKLLSTTWKGVWKFSMTWLSIWMLR
ncbi:Putative syntaxin [Arachis hypogaea]|nr:Putative syntaxin [Arachis hypogaea]